MGTSLADLRDTLKMETGGTLGDLELDTLLDAGVVLYNAYAVQEFVNVDGELDRDATSVERRALVLYGLLAFLNRELIKASLNAVSISNPAGKTDLTSVEWALGKRRKELMEGPLKEVLDQLLSSGIVTEVYAQELGETRSINAIVSHRSDYGW